MIRKAVIPAAGMGTRFLPITKAQPKEMIPVVHKPVIQYVVEEAVRSGIEEILIITGRGKRAIEDHFDRGLFNEALEEFEKMLESVNIVYIRQREPKGLADAVRYARSFASNEPFALLLGDTITIPECTRELMKEYEKYGRSIIAVEPVPREKISSYGIVEGKKLSPSIYLIERMVEKPGPDEVSSNLGILGRYVLTPSIFDAIDETPVGKGGELHLTDALSVLKQREEIYAYLYRGRRYDIGNKLDWLKANVELALQDEEFSSEMREFIKNLVK